MNYRKLGRTGINTSTLAFGTWDLGGHRRGTLDAKDGLRLIRSAYEHGVTTFDTSHFYGNGRSEVILGEALKGLLDTIVISKAGYVVGWDGAQKLFSDQPRNFMPNYLTRYCEESLFRLQREYLDVFLLHDPPFKVVSDPTPWAALKRLKKKGLVRFIGASVESSHSALEAMEQGAEVLEIPFNLLFTEPLERVFPVAAQKGVGILARGPFASGALWSKREGVSLTGKQYADDALLRRIKNLADHLGLSITQLAVRFAMTPQEISTVVCGVFSETELEQDVGLVNGPIMTAKDFALALEAVVPAVVE